MESAYSENVSSFSEKDEASERHGAFRDSTDRGKIIVVVSAAETKLAASNSKLRKKINDDDVDDDVHLFNVTSSVRSIANENLNNNLDGKENAKEKLIPGASKLSRGNCETDKIFPQQRQRTRANRSPRCESAGIPTLLCIDDRLVDAAATRVKPKIPRPANAFMLFANEWRRKLAAENPRDSNKDISIRLGIFWKNMSKDVKEKYFALAREVDKEHKRKYPVEPGVPSGQLRSPGSGKTASMCPAPSRASTTRRPNSRASARVQAIAARGLKGRKGVAHWRAVGRAERSRQNVEARASRQHDEPMVRGGVSRRAPG